jgi:dTDP-4-dehydrorhamnose 3,5-epimerase
LDTKSFTISGPLKFVNQRFADERGHFTETFNLSKLQDLGVVESNWVQDNQSYSKEAFTLRGLHFQLPPFAQAKIIRVLRGKIFDVAVDLRPTSPTFGKWLSATLSAADMNQFYVPTGFAHGFLTLEPHVEVAYKVSNYYSKDHDRSLNWADSCLAIQWPLPVGVKPTLSGKDEEAPCLSVIERELGMVR